MKYITQVDASVGKTVAIKLIVEINGKNIEVVECEMSEYGSNKGLSGYHYGSTSVLKSDFTFTLKSSYETVHLAEVVLAIELAKLIKKEVG